MAGWWQQVTLMVDSQMAFIVSLPNRHPHAVRIWALRSE